MPDRPSRRALVATAAVVVVVLAALALEVGGRIVVQRAAVDALAQEGVEGATVRIGRSWWRPTVLPALVGGRVDRVRVRVRDAEVSGLQVQEADYRLEDLEVDLAPFDRALGVSGIGRGTFRVVLAPGAVGEQLGVPARIVDGRLVVGPDEEPAKVRVEGDELVVESAHLLREGIDPRVATLDRRLLPCTPEVVVRDAALVLACSGSTLPGLLDTPLGEPVADLPAPPAELEPPVTAEREPGG